MQSFIQGFILVQGAATIWLLAAKNKKLVMLGFVVGLFGQPFWLYANYTAKQWGMFLLGLFYTYNFVRGIINNKNKK